MTSVSVHGGLAIVSPSIPEPLNPPAPPYSAQFQVVASDAQTFGTGLLCVAAVCAVAGALVLAFCPSAPVSEYQRAA